MKCSLYSILSCLIITLGARDVFKVTSPDEVFDTLERLLWDHANKVYLGIKSCQHLT